VPSYPTVHNGWIESDGKIKDVGEFELFAFKRFVEKPDLKRAEQFYSSPNYFIHVGYMAVKPGLFLSYYEDYAPKTYAIVKRIINALDTPKFKTILASEYPKFEKISVDYGLFEKLPPEKQWELPADFGWIDVGTWELLYHGLDKDDNGNVLIGRANLLDTKNSLIIAKKEGTMGIIGLDGMIVVETDDGLLVCPLSQAPKVKDLYNMIEDHR
jgi:mannose-1-phosphate guanylyltransferase